MYSVTDKTHPKSRTKIVLRVNDQRESKLTAEHIDNREEQKLQQIHIYTYLKTGANPFIRLLPFPR